MVLRIDMEYNSDGGFGVIIYFCNVTVDQSQQQTKTFLRPTNICDV